MKTPLVESTSVFADGTCSLDQLVNRTAASGKIVLCFSTMGMVSGEGAALAVYAGGGSGVIFADSSSRRSNQDNFLPTVHVNLRQGTHILNYIQSRSRQRPTVHVSASRTVVGSTPAPAIAYFSSRGPSSISPNILKPDVTAPGVNILAAWPPKSSPTMLPLDKRSTEWNFDTGTSMSCPHVTGIVAILRPNGGIGANVGLQKSVGANIGVGANGGAGAGAGAGIGANVGVGANVGANAGLGAGANGNGGAGLGVGAHKSIGANVGVGANGGAGAGVGAGLGANVGIG
uniref:Peptidase S8/S53 domain-containing protein n=1 Tax=Aegilops tauschii subsp. strangulata TaxID=200361 RepID=A0A453ITI8_AEGTS